MMAIVLATRRSAPADVEGIPDNTAVEDQTTTTSENLFPDDHDRDGISNAQEAELGLDASEIDTDFDGLTDAFELTLGTDPLNPDTDGDGIPDGREYLTFESDPLLADTDGDGFDDPTEINNGYNPNGPGNL